MHRFHLPPEQCVASPMKLRGDEAHHASRVVRVEPGETIEILDGAGTRHLCQVTSVSKSEVTLEKIQTTHQEPLAARVTLAAAVPKGQLFDTMVEQATELGVMRILPLMTERGNVRFDEKSGMAKRDKWETTALEALKQCGGSWLPEVHAPLPLKAALEATRGTDLSMLASLHPGVTEVREAFRHARQALGREPESIAIWIGPEGDFSPAELDQIVSSGARPITLGTRVLRCPTATIASLALALHEIRLAAAGTPGRPV